jgi:nitroimidazol reductase NimA-like FMN-containing flavoprotein (pyridoxamine 5'-phosphate oxidase superfamily)
MDTIDAPHDEPRDEARDEYAIELHVLDEDACWPMLTRQVFGRVGVVDDGEVVVLPVNAGVAERRIVFRAAAGSTLARHGDGAAVSFEVDHVDVVAESGWSVLVKGTLRDITGAPETGAWDDVDLHAWAPPPHDRWMIIQPRLVTGRVIQRHRRDATLGVPYMPPD